MAYLSREPVNTADFGAGAHAPYDHALRDPDRRLYLHISQDLIADDATTERVLLDVDRFLAAADDGDAAAMHSVTGPVIDIGCGPGRIVRAAIMAGHLALGIDVSAAAVEIAQERGLPVLCRSVFHDLPSEGTWGTALLFDGNIGIGGDPQALLERCAQLMLADGTGRVLVETHPDAARDRIFEGVVVDDLARASLPFPWAEVGSIALRRYAERAGLRLVREWSHQSRFFAEYAAA